MEGNSGSTLTSKEVEKRLKNKKPEDAETVTTATIKSQDDSISGDLERVLGVLKTSDGPLKLEEITELVSTQGKNYSVKQIKRLLRTLAKNPQIERITEGDSVYYLYKN